MSYSYKTIFNVLSIKDDVFLNARVTLIHNSCPLYYYLLHYHCHLGPLIVSVSFISYAYQGDHVFWYHLVLCIRYMYKEVSPLKWLIIWLFIILMAWSSLVPSWVKRVSLVEICAWLEGGLSTEIYCRYREPMVRWNMHIQIHSLPPFDKISVSEVFSIHCLVS